METLTLTQKQKDKLLEMCKFLFPEYNDFEITSSFPYYNSNKLEGLTWKEEPIEDAVCLIKDDKDDYRSITVHWFEFCMIILFKEFMKIKYINAPAFYTSVLSGENPIDYLYKLFKKLKK